MVLTLMYNTGNCCNFGLCPSSGTLTNAKEHNVSEIGSVSILRSEGMRHLLCWVSKIELTSVTGSIARPQTTRKTKT
jgi:hypothetical protein